MSTACGTSGNATRAVTNTRRWSRSPHYKFLTYDENKPPIVRPVAMLLVHVSQFVSLRHAKTPADAGAFVTKHQIVTAEALPEPVRELKDSCSAPGSCQSMAQPAACFAAPSLPAVRSSHGPSGRRHGHC